VLLLSGQRKQKRAGKRGREGGKERDNGIFFSSFYFPSVLKCHTIMVHSHLMLSQC